MTAACLPWAAELVLECVGSALNFKRSKLLALVLLFCAISDIALFFLIQLAARDTYATAYWCQHYAKGVLLCYLGCMICRRFMGESDSVTAHISNAFVALGAVALFTVAFFHGETLKDRLLDGEIAACFMSLALVVMGLVTRASRLPEQWRGIAWGFVMMVGSDLACTALWMAWDGARHWYPLGAISAQVVWIATTRHKLSDLRVSLEKKFPQVEEMRVM